MTKTSYKVQENFLRRYFVKNFLAAVLLALPDIFQHWTVAFADIISFFNLSHSNIFADNENDLPINPLFCQQDVFIGVSPTPPPIATALAVNCPLVA
jgi:hypothetical protein